MILDSRRVWDLFLCLKPVTEILVEEDRYFRQLVPWEPGASLRSDRENILVRLSKF